MRFLSLWSAGICVLPHDKEISKLDGWRVMPGHVVNETEVTGVRNSVTYL